MRSAPSSRRAWQGSSSMREAGIKEKGRAKTERIPIKIVPREPLAKPAWIRVRAPGPNSRFHAIKHILREQNLHTVCEEASCPNIAEDHEGRGALAEALGDVRAGGFLAHR